MFYGQLNLDSTDSQVLSLYTLHFCHNRKAKDGIMVSSYKFFTVKIVLLFFTSSQFLTNSIYSEQRKNEPTPYP